MDLQPRYAPDHVFVARLPRGAVNVPVIRYHSFPPGTHPANCPLIPTCTALELVTEHGSRWFGVERAWINSELRMVVSGTNPRDEVRMNWEVCKTP